MRAVDVYTRQCSTLITSADLAAGGATLAASGVNPLSRQRVISAANVPHLF
jgi:glutaminase